MIGLGLGLGIGVGEGGAPAPSWVPTAESGLCGWYKGNAGLVLGAFGSWADQSGIGNDLAGNGFATTAGPTLNAKATLHMPANAQLHKNSFSKGSAGAISMFLVMRVTTGQVAVDALDYGDGALDVTGVGFDGATTPVGMLHNFAANADGTTSLLAWHRVGITSTTGGNQILYVDNASEATQSASAALADTLNLLLTCSRAGVGDGDVAEIVIYDHVLSSGVRASLDGYLQTAWAL